MFFFLVVNYILLNIIKNITDNFIARLKQTSFVALEINFEFTIAVGSLLAARIEVLRLQVLELVGARAERIITEWVSSFFLFDMDLLWVATDVEYAQRSKWILLKHAIHVFFLFWDLL